MLSLITPPLSFPPQNCISVMESLTSGDLGSQCDQLASSYKHQCHAKFPRAKAFAPSPSSPSASSLASPSPSSSSSTHQNNSLITNTQHAHLPENISNNHWKKSFSITFVNVQVQNKKIKHCEKDKTTQSLVIVLFFFLQALDLWEIDYLNVSTQQHVKATSVHNRIYHQREKHSTRALCKSSSHS